MEKANGIKNKPLRIAFIVGEFPDEIGTFVLNQAIGLIQQGVNIEIFSLFRPEKKITSEDIEKYKLMEHIHYLDVPKNKLVRLIGAAGIILKNLFIHPVKIFKSLNFSSYGKVAMTLHPLYFSDYFLKNRLTNRFDIIHCHFGQRGLYGSVLKDIGVKGKLVTSFYGGDLSFFVGDVGASAYRPLFKQGDLFLPLSNNFGHLLVNLGCNSEKIKVHRVGINLDLFKLKKNVNKSKEIRLLLIGRFVEKKGHEYLIRALHLLGNKNVRLILVGDGPLKKGIRKLAENLEVEQQIEFVGSILPSQLPKFYHNAEVYVLPSVTSDEGDMEGTPVSLIEAQACGLPVVSTQHSGIPEVILNNKTGFLVEEKDSKALAEKIKYLIENPLRRIEMGREGRDWVMAHYDKEKQNKKLLDIYKNLVN